MSPHRESDCGGQDGERDERADHDRKRDDRETVARQLERPADPGSAPGLIEVPRAERGDGATADWRDSPVLNIRDEFSVQIDLRREAFCLPFRS